MRLTITIPVAVCLITLTGAALHAEECWPTFRGPNLEGIAEATGLPLTWSETENVKWKTPIHGRAWSSPVIVGDQIWLTTAPEDGRERYAVCVDRNTGKIMYDIKVFDVAEPQDIHEFNTYASPSPVIDPANPTRVYITFGSAGTACLDTRTGKILWTQRDLNCNHYRGAGASPILFENMLILPYDGSDAQFVAAMDRDTGKVIWKTDRSVDYEDIEPDGKPRRDGDFRKAFATANIGMVNGKPLLVSSGSKASYAYDPYTGKELWRIEDKKHFSASSTPVFGDGLIYIPTGLSRGEMWAVKPGGSGVVNDTHVAWKVRRGVPNKPSVLLIDGLLYMCDDGGIVSCLDAATGDEIWKDRVRGPFSASPLYADGRIYLFNEIGKTFVIAPGREFKQLAENDLDEGFMASPAVAGKAFYLRTKTHLYRIEK
ncbi:PQQ-binding-like beta-propeller repeat protein [Planctomycetales bacterium ZRK34]|nr:PQQ-binding-like beta-propeller repeat protein [Planctomycetales bacterium ZRK34]